MKDFNQITLDEKLGQLLVIGFKGLNLTDDIKEMIKKKINLEILFFMLEIIII